MNWTNKRKTLNESYVYCGDKSLDEKMDIFMALDLSFTGSEVKMVRMKTRSYTLRRKYTKWVERFGKLGVSLDEE